MSDLWQPLARRTALAGGGVFAAFFTITAFQLFNMTSWLGTRGIDAVTAGRMQGTSDLFFVAGVLLAGLLADWRGFRPALFFGFFALAALGYAVLGLSTSVPLLTFALSLMGFAFMPLASLMDGHLQPFASRNLFSYARVRAVGSITFTIILLCLMFLDEGQILALFYPAICVSLGILGLTILALPAHPVHESQPLIHRFKIFGQLLVQPRFLVFYLAVALLFGSHGAHYIYAIPLWREAGFSSEKIYGVLAWSVVVEIIFFIVAPKALTEQRAAFLLTLCVVAAMVRWLLWPFATGWTALLALHSLHVFTFALTHVTSIAFLRRRVPEAQIGSALALLPAIGIGVGMASSKWIAAQLYDAGLMAVFGAMAGFAALALPLLFILHRLTSRRNP